MLRIKDYAKIRSSVEPPSIDPREEEKRWCYFDQANCYLYAISLLYDTPKLDPGEIAGLERKDYYSDEELVERVIADMNSMGLDFRESSLGEFVEDWTCSWKIAILNCETNSANYDYHFLREDRNMVWSQKFSDTQHATEYDEKYKLISNPAEAKYSYNYHLVGYYVISMRKAA